MEEELDEELEKDGALSDEIAKRWDPEKLLRLVSKKAGKGERLDEATRARYEKKLGVDLSRVRIYTGSFAEEFTKAHSAEAVTVSSTGMIMMGNSPDRSMAMDSGQSLLAHELTHVAQASSGLHRSALPGGGDLATDEHEEEAESVEAQVAMEGFAASDTDEEEKRQDKSMKKIKEVIEKRVLKMLADDLRSERRRNGAGRFRA